MRMEKQFEYSAKRFSAPAWLGLFQAALVWAVLECHVLVAQTNAPTMAVYQVRQYVAAGGLVLEQETVDRIMREATGTNVSIAQISRALVKLRQACRDRGYLKAAVRLPVQPLTNGVAQVVIDQEPVADSQSPSPEQGYGIKHFEIRGNTVLSPEQIDKILSPVAGEAVNLVQLQTALGVLQAAYRERGFKEAMVTMPQQVLADGTVIVQVHEGALATVKFNGDDKTNAPPQSAPSPRFEVRRYDVAGNTLLSKPVLNRIFTNAIGAAVSLDQIQKALGDLQLAYRERGYAMVSVALPQQQLTNATVKVQVTEGWLEDVRVTGNRHFSSNNVMRALPSLREALEKKDVQMNSFVFHRELDVANQNRDRQLYPVLSPGPEPGSSAMTIKVKDRLPLHGRAELNNQSTPGTPDWRMNTSVQYNNFWQREHQAGLFYGFTPEAYKDGGQVPDYWLNRPLIANYGGYYRLPVGTPDASVEAKGGSAKFGYNEATHQFVLPPAGSRPDITLYGSISSSDTGTQYGEKSFVSQQPLLTIVSQDSGQNISVNDGVGGRFNIPYALSDTRKLNFSFGADWKHSSLESWNTNNFLFHSMITNSQGSQVQDSSSPSPQPARHNEVNYFPLALGSDYFQTDKRGVFSANLALSCNFVGDSITRFSSSTWNATNPMPASYYPQKSDVAYAKASLALARDQKLFKDWSLYMRASGQAASDPLQSTEQFALGGVSSVRGYYEGDAYGDAGWFASGELRTPYIKGRLPSWSDYVPVWVRGVAFVDYGQHFLLEGAEERNSMLGAGFGLSANINDHFDARITLGWPLLESANTRANAPRASFSIGGQF